MGMLQFLCCLRESIRTMANFYAFLWLQVCSFDLRRYESTHSPTLPAPLLSLLRKYCVGGAARFDLSRLFSLFTSQRQRNVFYKHGRRRGLLVRASFFFFFPLIELMSESFIFVCYVRDMNSSWRRLRLLW